MGLAPLALELPEERSEQVDESRGLRACDKPKVSDHVALTHRRPVGKD